MYLRVLTGVKEGALRVSNLAVRALVVRALAVRVLGSIALQACGAEGQFPGDTIATNAQSILGGEVSGPEEDAVLQVKTGTDYIMDCSATLVAPDVVVTALHCVAEFSMGGFVCDSDGNLETPRPVGVLGATFDPETIEFRMGAQPGPAPDAYAKKVFRSGAQDICKQDIAVVVLDRELDLPLSTMRLAKRPVRGEYMRAVGYGVNDADADARFTRSGLRVTDVGEDELGKRQGLAAPYTFVLTEGPCQGDSGGPAFSEDTGAVVGVYSISASADCGALGIRNIYTTVAPFEDLVLEAFDYAGRKPLLEPESDAGATEPAPTVKPREEDGGSGSRRDSSCAISPRGRRATHAAAALSSALLALVALRRRSRR